MLDSRLWTRRRLAVAAYLLLGGMLTASAQLAARGRALLDSKGCLGCHTLEAPKPGKAPPLGAKAPEALSPDSLAALLWNHDVFAPQSSNPAPKALAPGEARDLYAYFDSLRAFDPPGDPVRGKAAFDARCAGCHAGPRASASLARGWAPTADLADWAERMWNAAEKMRPALEKAGEPWPRLSLPEAADLIAYLQGLSGGTAGPQAGPTPAAGRRAFEQSGCAGCHAFGPAQTAKVDLSRLLRQEATNGGVAVALAGQRAEMERAAAERGLRLAPLPKGALASILEHMRAQAARGAGAGNRMRGEHQFRLKGCLGCHGMPRSGAPELKERGRSHDAYSIGGGLWRHAERARETPAHIDPVTSWPKLTAREIADLTAFLNGE